VIAYAWSEPHATAVEPLGEIEPPAPADASTEYGPFALNVAAIVWVPWTLVNV
jgi:hypothetical protein